MAQLIDKNFLKRVSTSIILSLVTLYCIFQGDFFFCVTFIAGINNFNIRMEKII